ncbi:MAG: hypothetical protein A2848_03330 [Candidatus Magasanikbacteria bacterium RIFCSPHIGHO2_01_FULL_50_8]|uniref:NADPH-dependent FMN reductase-like domain-containing protein n=1 Tax=Candidatus Magasanikbacteria bacterium RIFCSPHIGHO2_01_FULL_50_8 TaxID=1798674 RepID=A0A1F6LN33_9BACT|nr:MAG: hypothetical protein A2848_03330 [Candidatus Magasanikbacteria bacterium RIFCSPHIGHO2_01_FULL_50_8]
MFIPVLLGTGREGRQSEKPARFMHDFIAAAGHETVIVDVREFGVPATIPSWVASEHKNLWQAIAARADAFVVVSPEYNHGMPGELKMAIDTLKKEYEKKPIGICGVSSGALGGVRMVEQLRLVAIDLEMIPIKSAIYFSNVETFDPAPYETSAQKFLDMLVWYATALKNARI